ncbi:MAG TPA: histidine kinase, partial [Cytophagales bacterium]|nr:histidine kinase [Cytophagales bacterium]
MRNILKYRYFNVMLHALAWSMLLFFPYLLSDAASAYKIGPLPGLYFTYSGMIHIVIFYVNVLFLHPKFLNKTYWWLYGMLVVLLIFLSVQVKFYILKVGFPNVSPEARSHVLFPSVLLFIVSVFYSIAVDKVRAERLQKENEALQLEMEIKFLRSQISPHFLFNILTNLVSLARKKSDHLETTLLMLSELMRYMLYDVEKKIHLLQEVAYLESYIALQKMRFGSDVLITHNLKLPQESTNYSIERMLLIPFIENAFKHGIGPMDTPFIHIDLSVNG